MDPYLEKPVTWSAVHVGLIVTIQDLLAPVLRRRRYTVRSEERVYLSKADDPGKETRVPDLRVIRRPSRRRLQPAGAALAIAESVPFLVNDEEEVHDHFLEIRSAERRRSVVAVIEVLSPSNKMRGATGRGEFLAEREEIYATETHWMEIDLLRGGLRTFGLGGSVESGYQAFVSRHQGGKDADGEPAPRRTYGWRFGLRDRMPVVGVPLRNGEPDAPLDLQAAFDRVYDRGGYEIDFNYKADPIPPLPPGDRLWARKLTKGLGR